MRSDRQPICRFLRGKNAFGTIQGGETAWLIDDTVTTTYTCIETGEPFGPDNELAHPEKCASGRSCFTAPQPDF